MRPSNEDSDDALTDEAVSDEELEVTHEALTDALETRIGGRDVHSDDAEKDEEAVHSHRVNSSTGMQLAGEIWHHGGAQQHRKFDAQPGDEEKHKKVLEAARASQRREKSWTEVLHNAQERPGEICKLTTATPADVEGWLAKVHTATDAQGRALLNQKQYEMVARVAPCHD